MLNAHYVPMLLLAAMFAVSFGVALRRPHWFDVARPYAYCVCGAAFVYLGVISSGLLTAGLGVYFLFVGVRQLAGRGQVVIGQ